MKTLRLLILFSISLTLFSTSCSKDSLKSGNKNDIYKSAAGTESDIIIKGDGKWEKVITKPLVEIEGCDYIVGGTIEYYLNGELIATIDYGDGECDDIATKIVNGKIIEFSLKKEGEDDWFYKVITEPLVELEDCDYIVSGIIDFYSNKDNSWLATIDFGDGECDEWATKTTNEGTFEFSMEEWKWKY